MAITRENILEASMELLNEKGLEGLSMRKIASKLGVSAPTLYFHVKDKEDLCALLAEEICSRILDKVEESASLEELCFASYYEYRKVPSVAQIFQDTRPVGGKRLELLCQFLDKLSELGVSRMHLNGACTLLNNYILSFVAEFQKDIREKKESSDALQAYDFQYGLKVIITGLKQVKKG